MLKSRTPSIRLFVCQFVCLIVYLFVCWNVCPSFCLSVWFLLNVCPSFYLSGCLFKCLLAFLSVCILHYPKGEQNGRRSRSICKFFSIIKSNLFWSQNFWSQEFWLILKLACFLLQPILKKSRIHWKKTWLFVTE